MKYGGGGISGVTGETGGKVGDAVGVTGETGVMGGEARWISDERSEI